MPRYIDVDALVTNLDKALLLARTNEEIYDFKLCKEFVRDAPTVSPDEVRGRGKWEQKEIFSLDDTTIEQMQSARCSSCGKYHTTPFSYYFSKYNYCPSCGARLTGGEND